MSRWLTRHLVLAIVAGLGLLLTTTQTQAQNPNTEPARFESGDGVSLRGTW